MLALTEVLTSRHKLFLILLLMDFFSFFKIKITQN